MLMGVLINVISHGPIPGNRPNIFGAILPILLIAIIAFFVWRAIKPKITEEQRKTLAIIMTVVGGALGLWAFARFTSLQGQLCTWSSPLSDYETITLIVVFLAVILLIFGLRRLISKAK